MCQIILIVCSQIQKVRVNNMSSKYKKDKTTHTYFDLERSVMTDIEMLESKLAEEVRVKSAFLESIPTDISRDNVNLETIEKFINDCDESTDYVHHMDYQSDALMDDLRECLEEMKSRNLTVLKEITPENVSS